MAYDVELADRLRELLTPEPDLTEKRMFGGLAFLVGGRLTVAAGRDGGLILRPRPVPDPRVRRHDRLRAHHAARRRGPPGHQPDGHRARRPALDGWLRADVGDLDDDGLGRWVEHGVRYARSLPPT